MTTPVSVFDGEVWEHYQHFRGHAYVPHLVATMPTEDRVIEWWVRQAVGGETQADLIAERVAQAMAERSLTPDIAIKEAVSELKLNGFRRNAPEGKHNDASHPAGELFHAGYQFHACIKEAANILWPDRKWTKTQKQTRSFWPEHVSVLEDRLYLGVTEPDGIEQGFVQSWRGTSPKYAEYIDGAEFDFTIRCDGKEAAKKGEVGFRDEDWAKLWVKAQELGTGGDRSQLAGRFVVTEWEKMPRGWRP